MTRIQNKKAFLKSFLLFVPIFVVYFYMQYMMAPSEDALWLMLCAERWIDGQKYFYGFAEVNPPASILLHVPIIYLKNILPIPAYEVPFYYFSFLFFVSALLCVLIYQKAIEKYNVDNAFKVLLFALFSFSLILPGIHYGQRDYLLFLGILPFLGIFLLTIDETKPNSSLHWFCIFWASIFLVLKPHFYIVVAGLFLLKLYISKSFIKTMKEPSFYIIGSVAILYVLYTYFAFHEYYALMLSDIASFYVGTKLHSDLVYWPNLAERLFVFFILCGLACLIECQRIRQLSFVMLFLCALFYIAFIAQGSGFPYQYLPVQIFFYTTVSVIFFGNLIRFIHRDTAVFISYFLICAVSFALIVERWPFEHTNKNYEQSEKLAYLDQHVRDDQTYWTLMSSVPSYYYTNGTWGSRFMSLWFMHALLDGDSKGAKQKVLLKYQNAVVEDLMSYKPEIILMPKNTIFFDFMSAHSEFQNTWDQYTFKERKSFPIAKEIFGQSWNIDYDVYCLECNDANLLKSDQEN